jgi:hypothetical protein
MLAALVEKFYPLLAGEEAGIFAGNKIAGMPFAPLAKMANIVIARVAIPFADRDKPTGA